VQGYLNGIRYFFPDNWFSSAGITISIKVTNTVRWCEPILNSSNVYVSEKSTNNGETNCGPHPWSSTIYEPHKERELDLRGKTPSCRYVKTSASQFFRQISTYTETCFPIQQLLYRLQDSDRGESRSNTRPIRCNRFFRQWNPEAG